MARAAIVCLRDALCRDPVEMTLWADKAEAVEAIRVLCDPRCGPRCEGVHVLAYTNGDGGVHVATESAPPPSRDELSALYPRRWGDLKPEMWPMPAEFNPPLHFRHGPANITGQRMRRGEALALAQKL
ncbi:hypothetical protein [Mycobacterium sp.]|uniref:hypothetical protein n=1 Tax=Mycobacterium sp. TaxID=1785 RepID=UPI003F9749A1